ncbi:MAG TPA: S9 family peptidase [Gemmatimonadaceae bacterium]|jgi:dipeptidyl aminopeptidase/acylaminoacyl peptidase
MKPVRQVVVLCMSGALAVSTAVTAAAQSKRPMTFNDIMELKNLGGVALSPDGSTIAYTVSAWEHPNAKPASNAMPDTAKGDRHDVRSHIWLVAANGGTPRQVTFSERGEASPAWAPDGHSIAFISSRGAGTDVKSQVWVLPMEGGEAAQLTSSKESVTGFAWSRDGSKIAFLAVDTIPKGDEAKVARRDDPQVFEDNFRLSHAWVIDVASKRANEIVHGNMTVSGTPSWSPDGTRFAFQAAPTTLLRDSRSDIYVATISDRSLTKITTKPEAGSPPAWSPDGKTIAFTVLPQSHRARADSIMDREIGNDHLMLYDVASKATKDTYDAKVDVSAGNPQWTPDSKRVLFTTGERAYSAVYSLDMASDKLSRVADKLLIGGFSMSRDGQSVAYSLGSADSPSNVYVGNVSFAAPKKLTDLNPQLNSIALGETEIVNWKSTDGTPVEGVLLKPVGYRAGQKYPLLVEAHGGPTGATNASFKANWGSPGQVWAGQGWAVFYPNPRGSTNYGEKFTRANIMDWGGGDYRDIMTGVDAMVKNGLADSTKLAFEGWSYGGYMTAWVVSQTSRFKAARMGAGLADLQSMYGTTDIPGYIGTFFSGIPTQKTLDFYRARSAITFVDNVTTPLLIQHGGADPRVPTGQSMEYYRALKDRGKTVELVFYPREGHGLGEYYHQVDKMQREYDWITKYTLGTTKPVP